MSHWIEFTRPLLAKLPAGAGCYVFVFDNRWVYVGSTKNLRARFDGYRFDYNLDGQIVTPWGTASKFTLKFMASRKYGDWAMQELRLIKKLQPELNCVHSVRTRNLPGVPRMGTSAERTSRFREPIGEMLYVRRGKAGSVAVA